MKIKIPAYVAELITCLEQRGYETYCVGGCVRDSLLGASPQDWDLATAALPEELLLCFRDYRTLSTGLRHGTVTVISHGNAVEITTFRIDGSYADARHPDAVSFTASIEEDLKRRDFTVNAMAYHETKGLIDPYGGIRDLEAGVLRCVGAPAERFSEDALRIIRCLRFASVLGFRIEPATKDSAHALRQGLLQVSAERVAKEFQKLLCGKHAAETLRENSEILFTILPELAPMKGCLQETAHHLYDVWEHTLHALGHAVPKFSVRFALLLHDSGKPEAKTYGEDGTAHFYGHARYSASLCRQIAGRLRLPNRFRDSAEQLVLYHDTPLPMKEAKIRKLLVRLGEEGFFDLLDVMRGDSFAHSAYIAGNAPPLIDAAAETARRLIECGACLSMKQLAINGNDLKEIGFQDGKLLGDTLKKLFSLVIAGGIQNKRDSLLKAAGRMRRRSGYPE